MKLICSNNKTIGSSLFSQSQLKHVYNMGVDVEKIFKIFNYFCILTFKFEYFGSHFCEFRIVSQNFCEHESTKFISD